MNELTQAQPARHATAEGRPQAAAERRVGIKLPGEAVLGTGSHPRAFRTQVGTAAQAATHGCVSGSGSNPRFRQPSKAVSGIPFAQATAQA